MIDRLTSKQVKHIPHDRSKIDIMSWPVVSHVVSYLPVFCSSLATTRSSSSLYSSLSEVVVDGFDCSCNSTCNGGNDDDAHNNI